MPKLPIRVAFELAIICAILAGSCSKTEGSKFTMEQRDEIRDLAREAANSDNVKERLDAIEERLKMANGDNEN